jgi:hypothetical protein
MKKHRRYAPDRHAELKAHYARAHAETVRRTSTGRPPATGGGAGLGLLALVGIIGGGLIPLLVSFGTPIVRIAGEMGGFLPIGGAALLALVVAGRRRSRSRALAVCD